MSARARLYFALLALLGLTATAFALWLAWPSADSAHAGAPATLDRLTREQCAVAVGRAESIAAFLGREAAARGDTTAMPALTQAVDHTRAWAAAGCLPDAHLGVIHDPARGADSYRYLDYPPGNADGSHTIIQRPVP